MKELVDKVKRPLSIDPSINNLGWAIHHDKKLYQYGILHPFTKHGEYQVKSFELTEKIKKKIIKEMIDFVVIETPDHWSIGGFAARESGALPKLSFICGMICWCCYESNAQVLTVIPRRWKGQMPKEVMRNRMIVDFPDEPIADMDNNIIDGIGIGVWFVTKRLDKLEVSK